VRKFVFICFVVCGAAAGVLAALGQAASVKLVLSMIGAVAGAAIGGAIAGIGRRSPTPPVFDAHAYDHMLTQDEREQNYWLDRGRLTASPGLPNPNDGDPHSHES
jgi:hypothetical protein